LVSSVAAACWVTAGASVSAKEVTAGASVAVSEVLNACESSEAPHAPTFGFAEAETHCDGGVVFSLFVSVDEVLSAGGGALASTHGLLAAVDVGIAVWGKGGTTGAAPA
jgi:hypothetical protein